MDCDGLTFMTSSENLGGPAVVTKLSWSRTSRALQRRRRRHSRDAGGGTAETQEEAQQREIKKKQVVGNRVKITASSFRLFHQNSISMDLIFFSHEPDHIGLVRILQHSDHQQVGGPDELQSVLHVLHPAVQHQCEHAVQQVLQHAHRRLPGEGLHGEQLTGRE